MKNAAKYAVLALGPIILIVGILITINSGKDNLAGSVLFYNIITGDTERVSIDKVGTSVLKDDQNRRVRFIVVGEGDVGTSVPPGETMFIKEQDRPTFDLFLANGEFTLDEVKVDPETYQIIQ